MFSFLFIIEMSSYGLTSKVDIKPRLNEFTYEWIHYSQKAYNFAKDNLFENEYIIRKISNDSEYEKNYYAYFITNMGNVIFIDFSKECGAMKFSYDDDLKRQRYEQIGIRGSPKMLSDKTIDNICKFQFKNNHISKLMQDLKMIVEMS